MKTKPIYLSVVLAATLCSQWCVPQAFADDRASSQSSENIATTGQVVDEEGEPVIGAVVQVVGTSQAVTTDTNGYFNLGSVKKGSTVTVSYIGFEDMHKKWEGHPLEFRMIPKENTLNDLVVVGYGTVRKADLAGSVSVVNNKSFAAQPITQASEALQGRVAGVQVVDYGIPGGSVKIRVRGSNSINNSNDPLYVVDGMVRETGLEGINPEDIASIQVLKDASSTAIYGSRGANGVVLITTKTASKSGTTQITFDAQVGISNAIRLPKVMGTKEYAQALIDWSGYPEASFTNYLNGTDPGVDWNKEMFRTGVTQNYRLVLAKGNDDYQIYFSGNYMKHEGTLLGTQYERFSGKLNAQTKLTKWLNLTFDMQASRGISEGTDNLWMGANPLWMSFNYSPTMSIMGENGYYNWDPYGSVGANPVGAAEACESKRYRDVFAGHVDLKFNISKQLTFTTSNGIDYYNLTSYSFTPETYNGVGKGNSASNANTQRTLLQSVNNLTYINTWNDVHNLTATAVWEATKSTEKGLVGNSNNLLTESVTYYNLAVGTTNATNSYTDWSLLSAVGRVMYNYDNRYMLTGTFRADGSSRFQNKKWGYFPSIAAAWTISNESFFQDLQPAISNLKLRTSFGVVGNQDITPYSTMATLSQLYPYYGSTQYTGYWNNSIATPDLRWEKTNQFDVGVDAQFLNGRFDLSLDYFYKITSDALLLTSNAAYLGGASYYINAGKVRNTGVDIALSGNIIQGGDWMWNSSLNLGFLKNKVVKMTADTPALYAGSLNNIIEDYTVVTEGEAIGSFYGYEWAGIDSDGYDTYYDADGNITRNPVFTDAKVLGKAIPDLTLGFNNTITYKNWSLNAFFTGAFGLQRLNAMRFAMCNKLGYAREITAADYVTLWKNGEMADPTLPDNTALGMCSKYVENADYFRLDNLSLSYDLGKRITKFADIRLSLSVQNLFTITGYKGSNPTSYSYSTEGDRNDGVDTGTYPTVRTWTVGARFNF